MAVSDKTGRQPISKLRVTSPMCRPFAVYVQIYKFQLVRPPPQTAVTKSEKEVNST